MHVAGRQGRTDPTRRELLALLLASLACVVVLTLALVESRDSSAGWLGLRHLLGAALAAGAFGLALALVWYALRRAGRATRRAEAEAAALRRNLVTAEAIVKAEPQVLVFWEQAQPLKVVAHTLSSVPGVPEDRRDLIRFGAWLDAESAEALKSGLDVLFADGRPFNLLLKTSAGGHLEADGRGAGTRAVLRLRDVAGYKRDVLKILDQHRLLARDIRASRALLNALPMPVWLKGAGGRIEWVNKAYVAAVEAADETEVRERQIELLESRQRAAIEPRLVKHETCTKRMPLIVGGERKPHDVVIVPLEESTAAAAIDVTALETAQGELDRQVAAYDRTLDRVATAVAIFGRDQRLGFFNAAYQRLWDLDPDWLATRPSDSEILDRLREGSRLPAMVDYRAWKAKLLACYRTAVEMEDRWHLPDGRMLHMVAEQRPDGGVTYLYDDVTERYALESSYNALIGVQRETLDSLKEGVAVFATDGRLKLFNSSFASIWKLPRQALAGEPHVDQIIRLARDLFDDPRTWARISRTVTAISDQRHQVEGQMVRPDGSVIEFMAAPLPDGATVLTFADVTASKRIERALADRNEALVAADRLKSQFISHVSYELRTPLTNIIGFSELLASPRAGRLNDKQREYLGDISVSSRTLLAIIDDILDLATIDAGTLELKLTRVEVRAVLDSAILGVRERASRARLTLDIAVTDDAVAFMADESRVRQVIYNLLSNAVGFSNPGDTINVSCWQEGGMVAFSVEDQGVGIPKDQQRRIFERFESRSYGSKHRGAGLGLSIVKSLVELHGGDMRLDSEPGRGTRVTVRFPEATARPADAEPAAAQA
ncbi:MAG: PAS domain-containing sensor histidine kinase [Hyphomicrobiaceae bacterium]|nr:PAS domain-containing sensor histidine kinase [Hyphomicrobiaceae bacterium]